jgi:hypothetical protein
MLNGNQISTIVLLIILGAVIYCLTKPPSASEDTFVNTEEKKAEEPVKQPVNVAPVPQNEVRVVAPEVVRQIVNETEPKSEQVDSVFNFGANDSSSESGASLETAFSNPLPPNVSGDVVDVNKNNVKNYNAKDFLPKEINDEWFDTDFSQAKYNVNDDKLINTERYVIGINTVGQSLKNASYDIRGTIPNPKFSISPWNNSTYEPDFNLKPLC